MADTFVDLMAQHSTHLHRASSRVVDQVMDDFERTAKKMRKQIIDALDELTASDLRAFTSGSFYTENSRALRDVINLNADTFNAEWTRVMNKTGVDLAAYESQWIMQSMQALSAEYAAVVFNGAEVYKRAMKQPIVGYLFDETLQGVTDGLKKRTFAHIRTHAANGATNDEIIGTVRDLFGRNGAVEITRTSIERTIRTVRSHVSSESYMDAYKKLGVKRIRFSATLDLRTSKGCSVLDGQEYDIDKPHPTPPLHPNCRSQLIPVSDLLAKGMKPADVVLPTADGRFLAPGQLSAKDKRELEYKQQSVRGDTTYAQWFARQDAKYQRAWLGKTRYELYKKGGYTIDRFVDPQGAQYTLDQLAQHDKRTFKALGLLK